MMIVRLILLPALSLGGISLAAWSVHKGDEQPKPTPGLTTPAVPPFPSRVSATGVVEASTRNVGLGVARPGLVAALPHDIGSDVTKGDLLLQIDDRDLRAQLAIRKADLASAEQELARLVALPRAEDLAPLAAAVAQRRAQLTDSQNLLRLATAVGDPRAISREELTRRESAVAVAQATLAAAEAELERVEVGAWAPDLAIARARVDAARAGVASVEAELQQLQVTAPFDGKVLQVNVRVGEYAAAGPSAEPAIVLGAVRTLHVRADIDEMDVWRLRPEAPARAFVRGNPKLSAPLRFVAVEPLMIPKRSLSGSSREQVDTRVLQVLYALDPTALPVQVGQLVDVFVESLNAPGATDTPAEGTPK
ncbi:MAG: biotin/lipoyl-binding protein [Planctomycetes bacterium]|nr:biotin/lipoyl-binding protein [Planctomycetota bacterium]